MAVIRPTSINCPFSHLLCCPDTPQTKVETSNGQTNENATCAFVFVKFVFPSFPAFTTGLSLLVLPVEAKMEGNIRIDVIDQRHDI
jgi:hypothetical protein